MNIGDIIVRGWRRALALAAAAGLACAPIQASIISKAARKGIAPQVTSPITLTGQWIVTMTFSDGSQTQSYQKCTADGLQVRTIPYLLSGFGPSAPQPPLLGLWKVAQSPIFETHSIASVYDGSQPQPVQTLTERTTVTIDTSTGNLYSGTFTWTTVDVNTGQTVGTSSGQISAYRVFF